MKANSIKTVAVAFVSLLLLSLSIAVSGQRPEGPGGPPPGGGFPGAPWGDGLGPIARDLNLSDDQKTQINKITETFRKNTEALRDQLVALRESEPEPLTTAYDEDAVRGAAEARAKVEIELSVARAKMFSQIGTVLTSEQKIQIAAKREEFSQRRRPPQE